MKKTEIKIQPPLKRGAAVAAISHLILALALACILGCSKPSPLVYSNPNDPLNPDFSNPTVAIIQGPAEGSAVTNNNVTVSWQGVGSAVEYSYALDTGPWSSWTSQSADTLLSLYEGGHAFNIKARNELQQEGPVLTRNFTVNNVSGPALMISPRDASVNLGSNIYIFCMLEEIGQPVMGAHLIMTYDTLLTYLGADVVGCIWDENGGTIIGPYDYSGSGIIDWSVSVAGGTPAGINPVRGPILRVCFRGQVRGPANVSYLMTSGLRDTLNNAISPFVRPGCTITVK